MNPKIQNASSVLTVEFDSTKNKKIYCIIKRLTDIIFGIIGTLFCIPIYIFIKISYMFQKDFTPVIFMQERIGQNGKPIKIFKFRSMIPNAETVLEELMEKIPLIMICQ